MVTVKVSGWYKKNSTNENLGYFNYITQAQNVTVQRMNKPIINGPSPIPSINQDSRTYTIANNTNATDFLWSVNNGSTIVGSSTGTSVVVQPPLCGTFTVTCAVKRSAANNNYVLQGSKAVTRDEFQTSATITGSVNICPLSSSTYTVSNLGTNTVNWSISDATLASLSTTNGSTVTVNAISEGSIVLTATIANSCNQTAPKTFDINLGSAKLTNNKILGGYDNVPVGSQSILNITPATGATSYQWSIVPTNSSCISSNGTVTGTLPYLVNNGTYSKIIRWGNCTGSYRVRCYASNSCGAKYYSDKSVLVFNSSNNPCPPPSNQKLKNERTTSNTFTDYDSGNNIINNPYGLQPCNNSELPLRIANTENAFISDVKNLDFFDFSIYPNPSNGNFNINFGLVKVKYSIEIYSSLGRKVHEKLNTYDTTVSVSNLKSGIYMVKVLVNNETIVKTIVVQ